MIRAVLLATLAAATVATDTFPFAFGGFSDLSTCSCMPNRPPTVMRTPPPREDICAMIDCPRAPGQCFQDSECVDGVCLAPRPLAFGTPCDDHNDNTMEDVCSGNGECIGKRFTCPPDMELTLPVNSVSVQAHWSAPSASFATGSGWTYDSNYAPGAFFGAATLDAFESFFNPDVAITCQGGLAVCTSPRSFLPPRLPRPPMMPPKFFSGPSGQIPTTTPVPTTTTTTTTTRVPTTTTTTTTRPLTTTSSTTTRPGTTVAPTGGFCNFRQVDVLFVLDASGSVGQANFNLAQQFVISAVSQLDVGLAAIRVAGMMFHAEALPQFDFDDYTSAAQVQNAVANFNYPVNENWGTATGNALDSIRTNLLQASAGYRGGEVVVYFITDGVSQESPSVVESAAQALRATGAQVMAIGITDQIDETQLEVIAGSADNVITVADFANLNEAVRDDLVSRVCIDTPSTTASPTTGGGSGQPAATSAALRAIVSVAEPDDVCENFYTRNTNERCSCPGDCHTCDWNDGAPGACHFCKNAAYLMPNGVCGDSCPTGSIPKGSGNFRRYCEVPTVTEERCLNFVTDVTGTSCRCPGDCHTCAWINGQPGECEFCKNAAYLQPDGTCDSGCPRGTTPMGSGNFRRYCAEPVADEVCQNTITNVTGSPCSCSGDCHTCDWTNGAADTCHFCKNAAYLQPDGTCADSCPAGTIPQGSGNFRRYCEVPPTTPASFDGVEVCDDSVASVTGLPCTCSSNCHTCSLVNGVAGECTKCRNQQYLLDGECLASCPSGYTGVGTGNYKRVCVANRRRSILGLESFTGAASAVAGETGSPLLIAATVLGVFAVVVGAIVSARKSLKSRRDSLLPLAEVEDDAARSTSPLASVDATH
ncbi:uncharacterized protein MONBRDRAFT_23588 [Monosiga brevicollis MX1]|uniref:VWFA domain-containing protein n=1 Tax=Monosiga brevicollis TaxID=81824 RepID=A9UTW1_MONBE|nr:uncharacterized protein MONBRDRAFT_23588 [Monosiga brevicollis MX1]EDQ91315.1 predicted protein [Monosiga brevicollis MX1]|eukprot:XP_001743737.1 hypothetical protein [Monosiga brevicollis MX1]